MGDAPAGEAEATEEVEEEREGPEPEIDLPVALPPNRPNLLLTSLLFALVGLLVGLHSLAAGALPHILAPGATLGFLEQDDSFPIPRLLDWNLGWIEWLQVFGGLSPFLAGLAGVVVFGALGLRLVRILNPTFRLLRVGALDASESDSNTTAGESALNNEQNAPDSGQRPTELGGERSSDNRERPPGNGQPGSNTPALALSFDAIVLKKFFALSLLGLLPGLCWLLASKREGGDGDALRWQVWRGVCWIITGVTLWTTFRPDGLAGDFTRPSLRAARGALPGLFWRGALWGLGAYILARWAAPSLTPGLLLRYHTLGTFHKGYWNDLAARYLASQGLVWFAGGALTALLASRAARPVWRMAGLFLSLAAVGLALLIQRPLALRAQLERFDLTPDVARAIRAPFSPERPGGGVPSGPRAGRELARLAGLTLGQQPVRANRDVLLFHVFPAPVAVVRQSGFTEDGLTADPASATRTQAFLQSRHFKTALSWTASKHLFSVAALQFNTTGALAACLQDLIRCPHLARDSQIVRSLLFTCAASPQNLALLDQLADENNFAHSDRFARRVMGDLYLRFGAVDKALAWYRRAEMPRSFLARVRAEKPMFHQGRVTGTLTWNGRPLAGVQVGALPRRLNGLPPDLEPTLLRASGELLSLDYSSPLFPPYHPQPFAFRWLSAGTQTDAQGNFALDNLVEGEYRLVCTLPPTERLALPNDSALRVANPPDRLSLGYATPTVRLGTIALTYHP